MIRLSGIALLFLVLAPTAVLRAQEGPDVHVDETYGFELQRPGESWVFVPKPGERSTELQLILTKPKPLARLSVRVYFETTPSDPGSTRTAMWRKIAGEESISDPEEIEFEVAGRSAPGLSMIAEGAGERYRVRQVYLVEAGRRFELEDVIFESEAEALADDVDAIWTTFRLIAAQGPSPEEALLFELAARCGSEVKLAKDWKDASARAREEGKLVAVAVHLLSGFDIENPWLGTSFMDPELIDLFNERYVPVLFRWGWDAPFEDQGSYGMGPYSFGRTLLLVTPDGDVVAEGWAPLDDFLRDALRWMPGTEPESSLDEKAGPLDRAEESIRRGEFARARRLLEGDSSARGFLLRADISRRKRNTEAWKTELVAARQADGAAELATEIDLGLAEYAVATGESEKARRTYVEFLKRNAGSPRAPEVAWLLGRIEEKQIGPETAKERWLKLIAEFPESRWAWQAAYMLRSQAFAVGRTGTLEWPSPERIESLLHPVAQSLELDELGRAREEAISFLLDTQYVDGSWICPMEIGVDHETYPMNLTEAVTAICARSLLPFRDRPAVAGALEAGLEHLIDRLEADLDRELPVLYMDYADWNRASQVLFFAECLQLGVGDRERIEGALKGALLDLRERQHERGGWSYFISGDIDGGESPITQSISFTTAYVVLALAEALDAGVELPVGLAADAIGCLERMRNENGTYVYMLNHADEAARRLTGWEGSAGRGPLCSLAVFRHGRGSHEEIRMNLVKFIRHRGGLTKQLGRALMHAGPAAEGSHWVLFDYATASEAVTALPDKERSRYVEPFLEDILSSRRADGSYLDNLILGRAMGTAMALIAFENLGSEDRE